MLAPRAVLRLARHPRDGAFISHTPPLASPHPLTQLQLYNVLDGQRERIKSDPGDPVLLLSRGTAIILLLLYVLYLFFQLSTHHNLFDSDNERAPVSERSAEAEAEGEVEEPCMGAVAAATVLVVTTVVIAICADYLVGSIDDVVATAGISKTFVGLILIPIVGNAAEHVTAVVVAMKNKMDLVSLFWDTEVRLAGGE